MFVHDREEMLKSSWPVEGQQWKRARSFPFPRPPIAVPQTRTDRAIGAMPSSQLRRDNLDMELSLPMGAVNSVSQCNQNQVEAPSRLWKLFV